MEKVRFGVVGLGDGGMCNIRGLLAAGAEPVALCDIDTKVLHNSVSYLRHPEVTTELNDIDLFDSFEVMVKQADVDLIVVATPDNDHLEAALLALQADKFVFIEKPLATTLSDLDEFVRLNITYPGKMIFGEKYSFGTPITETLDCRSEIGSFMTGHSSYTMWNCNRIMGDGKWRTEHAYNPCAGGLSHNFMTALLFSTSPIVRISATGQVLTYHQNLDLHDGYDTMHGVLEFNSGHRLTWSICLAVHGPNSPYGHRTVTHTIQFSNGCLVYGPNPSHDMLICSGKRAHVSKEEPAVQMWGPYNSHLYERMHQDTLNHIRGEKTLHNIQHGINVAAACALAFESAKSDGKWIEIPSEMRF